ncbi:Uncharacterised protein [Mycobacterium tuberculosis]|uniref:Uncharacterized protein n=1 Tax=Mycobacterium tuberculosis TaxID=1773 RepID=A0A654TSH9_MYCTX|nr:Uncharacterised protein [Mycobacterium tuberculosis]CKN92994.1 Uncharacterised protein [Mycobacterium tuberculosis]CKT81033.1 Uncharacterised protein [Mycobacterium tuberculosis]
MALPKLTLPVLALPGLKLPRLPRPRLPLARLKPPMVTLPRSRNGNPAMITAPPGVAAALGDGVNGVSDKATADASP